MSSIPSLISELVGKSCTVKIGEAFGVQELECDILSADDEWIKIRYMDKKKGEKIKILRIDSIEAIELTAE